MSTKPKTPEAPAQDLPGQTSSNGELSADLARKRATAIAQRLAAFKRMSALPTEHPNPEAPSQDATTSDAPGEGASREPAAPGSPATPAGEARPRPSEFGQPSSARRGDLHPFVQAYAIGQAARRRQAGEPVADTTDHPRPAARSAPDEQVREPARERSRAESPSRPDVGEIRRQALYGSDFSALMRAKESARTEATWAEAALAEAARAEAARAEAARIEAERAEAARLEAARAEAAWEAAARAEVVEAARAEAARVEAARVEAARAEAQRADAKRVAAERAEAERVEAERAGAERDEAVRAEAARADAERAEAERTEAARTEAERIEAERVEAERQDELQLDEALDEAPLDDARRDAPAFDELRRNEIRFDDTRIDDLRRDEPWLDEAVARAVDADNPRKHEPEIDEFWLDEARDDPAVWAPLAVATHAPARRWPRRVASLAGFVAIAAAALGATFLWQLRGSGPGSQPSILAATERAADKLAEILAPDPQPQVPSESVLATNEAASAPPEVAPELEAISEAPSAEVAPANPPTSIAPPADETPASPIVARASSANHPPATRPGSSRPATTLSQLPDSEAIGDAPIVAPPTPDASGQAMTPQPFSPNASASPAAKPKPRVTAALKPDAAQSAAAPNVAKPVAQSVAKPAVKPAKPAAKPAKATKTPEPIKQVLDLLAPFMNGSKPQKPEAGSRK